MAHNRVEKHKGVTLVVRDDWMTIWLDATGHSVMGPVSSDDDVQRIASIAVVALRQIDAYEKNPNRETSRELP